MKEENPLDLERHLLLFDQSMKIKEDSNVFLMQKEMITIGRQSAVDIPLRYEFVSREHATIVQFKVGDSSAFRYHIFDGGKSGVSTNGIRVNKEKVVSAELTHGDVVTIGKKLKFVYLNLYLSDVELKKYMTLISLQDHINEATGREIGLVSKKFCRSTDTAFKTQVIE